MLTVLFFIGGVLLMASLLDWIIEVWQKHQQRQITRYNAQLDLKPREKQR